MLDPEGKLTQPGWAKDLLLQYKRVDIKLGNAVLFNSFGIAFAISVNAYLGLVSVTFFDFEQANEHTVTILTLLPLGKYNMPESSHAGGELNSQQLLPICYPLLQERACPDLSGGRG